MAVYANHSEMKATMRAQRPDPHNIERHLRHREGSSWVPQQVKQKLVSLVCFSCGICTGWSGTVAGTSGILTSLVAA